LIVKEKTKAWDVVSGLVFRVSRSKGSPLPFRKTWNPRLET